MVAAGTYIHRSFNVVGPCRSNKYRKIKNMEQKEKKILKIVKALRRRSPTSLPSDEFKENLSNQILNMSKDKNNSDQKKNKFFLFNYVSPQIFGVLIVIFIFTLGTLSIVVNLEGDKQSENFTDETKETNKTEKQVNKYEASYTEGLTDKGDYKERKIEGEGSDYIEGKSIEEDRDYSVGSLMERDNALEEPDTGALPPVEREVQESLRGGKVNDNEKFNDFLDYVSQIQYDGFDLEDYESRKIITVESNGKRVLGESVKVKELDYTFITDSDGQIYLYPALINDLQQSNSITLDVLGKEYEFNLDEDRLTVKLDEDIDNIKDLTLDLVFTIDTTGSMTDQIEKLKDTVADITDQVQQLDNSPKIRYGMVVYRDKGDQYLTRVYDFTESLKEFQRDLDQVEANGGGDYEEDVHTALKDSIENLSWSKDKNTVKINFLIADAPPHEDYQQQYDFYQAANRALSKGIKIYPLASSGLDNTRGEMIFRHLALVTNAQYVFITDAQGGTDYNVPEENYSIAALDKLIVSIIEEEIEDIE